MTNSMGSDLFCDITMLCFTFQRTSLSWGTSSYHIASKWLSMLYKQYNKQKFHKKCVSDIIFLTGF